MKMQEKKKELLKKFKVLVEDLLDNYDKYTDAEKAQVKELFEKAAELNAVLDKYDIETEFDWREYLLTVGQYFDAMRL
jgi:hypothetical protein